MSLDFFFEINEREPNKKLKSTPIGVALRTLNHQNFFCYATKTLCNLCFSKTTFEPHDKKFSILSVRAFSLSDDDKSSPSLIKYESSGR